MILPKSANKEVVSVLFKQLLIITGLFVKSVRIIIIHFVSNDNQYQKRHLAAKPTTNNASEASKVFKKRMIWVNLGHALSFVFSMEIVFIWILRIKSQVCTISIECQLSRVSP